MSGDTRKLSLGRSAGYLLYGVLAGMVFLYLLFPVNRLERFAVARIAEATALQLEPQERRVGFPLNVEWRRVLVKSPGSAKTMGLQGEQVSLRFAVLPLLDRKVSADYSFALLGGAVSGTAEWQRGVKPFAYYVRGNARDLLLTSGQQESITTRLRAEWEYRWDSTDTLKGQGLLTVDAGGVTLKPLWPDTRALVLRRLTARIGLSNGIATVEDIRGEGDDGAVRGGGTVILQEELKESVVNLNLELRPRDSGPSALPPGPHQLVIKGLMRAPSVFVDGILMSSPQLSL